MSTIAELKEHLKKGGKIHRPFWGKGKYVTADLDEEALVDEDGYPFYDIDLLCSDWSVYGEPIAIKREGFYKTRSGKTAYITVADSVAACGVIDGDKHDKLWFRNGSFEDGLESPEDIMEKLED
jgi:hypothetical protein